MINSARELGLNLRTVQITNHVEFHLESFVKTCVPVSVSIFHI